MSPSPLRYRSLPFALSQGREALLSLFRPILNHFNITEQQWRVMRCLSEEGPMEQRLLSERCQILAPSLTGILARMQQMSLIERCRLPNDQRRVMIHLSADGQARLGEMAPLVDRQYQLIEQAWGVDVLRDTFTQVDRLLAAQATPVPLVPLPDHGQALADKAND
jgi:homoprotocatechuate degradation regulator HpaR